MEGMAVAIRSDPLYYAERPWVAGSIRRSQKPIRYMKGVPGSSETKFSNIPFAPSDKKKFTVKNSNNYILATFC